MKKNIFYFIAFIILAAACNTEKPNKKTLPNQDLKVPELSEVQKLYKTNCAICHGMDGKKGFSGAKDLSASQMDVEERIQIISQGKNTMMPYKGILIPEEIEAVAAYTLTLN